VNVLAYDLSILARAFLFNLTGPSVSLWLSNFTIFFLETGRLGSPVPTHSIADSLVYSLLDVFSMAKTLKIRNQSRGTNAITMETDYSIFTLLQLFKERYWIDSHRDPNRGKSLEEEIQKRCTHIRERTNGKPSVGSSSRFRPYGLIFGVVFLSFSVGPFVAVKFLDAITVLNDVSGDKGSLSGVWALLTLPVTVIVFMIGGMMDVERVVRWFNLTGRQNP
jgi:hypothetical protein